jgi:hypothetical protein
MTNSFLPENVIFRPANAQQIKQAEVIRQHAMAADKRRYPEPSKFWRNHVASVMGFRRFLWRHGGIYRSPLEALRRLWGIKTIRSPRGARCVG